MTDRTTQAGKHRPATKSPSNQPAWAKELRAFYDSVVDEPLPDDMVRLLASLDVASDGDDVKHACTG
jgi:Anti-sigma factor NepR